MTQEYFKNPLFLGLVFFSFILSCQNFKYENPYDPNSTGNVEAVSNLTAVAVSDTSIRIQWAKIKGGLGFRIERRDTTESQYVKLAELTKDSTQYLDTNVLLNRKYYYRVVGFNAANETANEISILHVFLAPTNLLPTQISESQIQLKWTDNSTFEKGYRLFRKNTPDSSFSEIGAVEKDVTTYIDNGLQLNVTYSYRVNAFTALNKSPDAEATIAHILNGPDSLNAMATSDFKIQLNWQDRSNIELGFKIKRKIGVNGNYMEIAKVDQNLTTFIDGTVNQGSIYYYQVTAFTTNFESGSVETSYFVFPAPSNLSLMYSLSETSIRLKWQDNSNFESGFYVERQENDETFYQIAQLNANVTFFDDLNLKTNSIHSYRVRAFTLGYESVYSNKLTVESKASWEVFREPSPYNFTIDAVHFVDPSWGWRIEGEDVYFTSNGGAEWTRQSYYPMRFRFSDIFFPTRNSGWAVGQHLDLSDGSVVRAIYRTTDGGISWTAYLASRSSSLSKVFFLDAQNGWAVGQDGRIFKTTNGGASWFSQNSSTKGFLSDVFFISSATGWVLSSGPDMVALNDTARILKTTNGGTSWTVLNTGSFRGWLSAIHFADQNYGWAVGGDRAILHTEDGGKTWRNQDGGKISNVEYYYSGVHFFNKDRGWVIGTFSRDSNALILYTDDGGNNWIKVNIENTKGLTDFCFLNEDLGWAVGFDGLILKYSRSWHLK